MISRALAWSPELFVILVCLAIVVAGIALHFPMMWINRRLFVPGTHRRESRHSQPPSHDARDDHSELGGHFLGAIGVLYAVLLGFVVVTAWQQFDHSEEVAIQEQWDVAHLFDAVRALHSSDSAALAAIAISLDEYAYNMVSEGAQMRRGERLCEEAAVAGQAQRDPACAAYSGNGPVGLIFPASSVNDRLLAGIRRNVMRLRLRDLGDQFMHQHAVLLLDSLLDARDHRRHHYREPMPPYLWIALFIGALLVIAVPYLQAERNSLRQGLRTAVLCMLIGLMFGLTAIFDHPFTGTVAQDNLVHWCDAAHYIDSELNVAPSGPSCSMLISQ